MNAIEPLKRLTSRALLAVALAMPLLGSGCTADVSETEEVIDDTGAEVDETSVKEDASVRPSGRFELAEFEAYGAGELDVNLGYTYALEVYEGGWGTRDYGVRGPSDGPQIARRDVQVKFTRSGTKRYIRLTDESNAENPVSVRYEYKMSRGNLRLRAERSTRWYVLEHAEYADADVIDEVKTYYNENAESADESEVFEGELPFNVELNVGQINEVWGMTTRPLFARSYTKSAMARTARSLWCAATTTEAAPATSTLKKDC
ncbi:MAG: hypothetical protein IPK60_14810 [Sandaracinaceae bacterium]|nr:hypothetical protein [Sandaracinaceae bacterium]